MQTVKDIGLRGLFRLQSLSFEDQLQCLADGFPTLLQSAEGLFDAAVAVGNHPRSAVILQGQAEEELAKILILLDYVRCPKCLRQGKFKDLIKRVYNHLARLIYIEAIHWRPTDMRLLQSYIDNSRESHILEGGMGEYIISNYPLYRRETALYADLECDQDQNLEWNNPERLSYGGTPFQEFGVKGSQLYPLCMALKASGALSFDGLKVVSSLWGQVNFERDKERYDALAITRKMYSELQREGLQHGKRNSAGSLVNWPMPLYNMNLSPIKCNLADLKQEQALILAQELGIECEFGD